MSHRIPLVLCGDIFYILEINVMGGGLEYRYQIIERLGSGGMGEVFAVRDMLLGGRAIALKRGYSSQQNANLEGEFKQLVKLAHPVLPAVHACGVDEKTGGFYFTMEWCRGGTLEEWLRTGPGERARMNVLAEIFRCVGHLHDHGAVHGDLSPANILVRETPLGIEVKVLDLGLSTSDGSSGVSGALPYLAPECLEGAPKSSQSDVFSLGILTYLLVFERHPWPDYPRGDFGRVLFPNGSGGLRRAFRNGIERALNVSPKERPRDAHASLEHYSTMKASNNAQSFLAEVEIRVAGIPFRMATETFLADLMDGVKGREGSAQGVHLVGGPGMGRSRALTECDIAVAFSGTKSLRVENATNGADFSSLHVAFQELFENQVTGDERIPREMPEVFQDAIRRRLSLYAPGGTSGKNPDEFTDSSSVRTEYLDALVRAFLWTAERSPLVLLVDDWERVDEETRAFLTRLCGAITRGAAPGITVVTAGETAFFTGTFHEAVVLPTWAEDELARVQKHLFPQRVLSRELVRELLARGGGNPKQLVLNVKRLIEADCLSIDRDEVRIKPSKSGSLPPPQSIIGQWSEKIAELAGDSRSLFQSVVWAGSYMQPREISQISGIEFGRVRDTIAALTRKGLLGSLWWEGEKAVGCISTEVQTIGESLFGLPPRDWTEKASDVLAKSGVPGAQSKGIFLRVLYAGSSSKIWEEIHRFIQREVDGGTWNEVLPLLDHVLKPRREIPSKIRESFYLLRGIANRGGGNLDDAQRDFESVLSSGEDSGLTSLARGHLGSLLVIRGRYTEARGPLQDATTDMALSPLRRAELWAWHAHASLSLGDWEGVDKGAVSALKLIQAPSKKGHAIRARVLRTQGLRSLYLGERESAKTLFIQARQAAEGNLLELASVDSCIALSHFREGHLDGALTVYKRALSALEQAGSRVKQGALLMNLGVVYQGQGSYKDAFEQYLRALDVAEFLEDKAGVFRITNNLGNVCVRMGQLARAEEYIQRSRETGLGSEQPYLEAFNITLLGEIARERRQFAEAEGYFGEALSMFESLKSSNESTEVRLEMGELAFLQGEYAEAKGLAESVYEASGSAGLSSCQIHALVLLAEVERRIDTGDLEKADAYVAEALQIASTSETDEKMWLLRLSAARVARDQGNLEQARDHAREGIELLRNSLRKLPGSAHPAYLSAHERGAALEEFRWVEALGNMTLAPQKSLEGGSLAGRKLLEINKRLNGERNLERLLEFIMDSAVFMTGAERGFLLLREGQGEGALEVRVARNIDQENVTKGTMKISNSIAEKVLAKGEPVITVDAMEDDRYREMLSVHQQRLRSVLCLPLRRSGKAIGVLYIDNRFQLNAFGTEDMVFMEAFADQAAIAIGNASLFEENQRARTELEQSQARVEELNRQLEERLQRTNLALQESRTRVERQQTQLENRHDYKNIVGSSDVLRDVLYRIDRVKDVDVPILIMGESGTGKELVARAIHYNGVRKSTEIVPVNCGAIPANLFESELFGHVRGAFTGASQDKIGLFEVAHRGTLFLDEIGEMPLELQVKLLRVLQSGEFHRLGEQKIRRVDVRIVAATNRNLADEVKEKRFREDLYYRLNVVSIELPPLRERMGDLPLLVQHLIENNLSKKISKIDRISADALSFLAGYHWPGNIRELDTTLKNASLFASGECLEIADFSHLPHLFDGGGATRASEFTSGDGGVPLGVPLAELEREAIIGTLESLGGNKKKTAEVLGIDRRTLYNKLDAFGVKVEKRATVKGR